MNQSIKYQLNLKRIDFLIQFYKIDKKKILEIANDGITAEKNKLTYEDFEKKEIKLSTIKKIDKVFQKGLTWYIDKTPPLTSRNSSIFFRKQTFNTSLSLEDIKITNEFEEKRILMQILCKNIDHQIKKKIKKFTTENKVTNAITLVKNKLIPAKKINWQDTKKDGQDKEYLKYLCRELEQFDVFIFEYLEHHNKIARVNLNGFYLKNTIVIKRQDNVRREIFTLLHEFAHFLLDEEEIDEEPEQTQNNQLYQTEKWCNDFAFQFLIDNKKEYFKKLDPNPNNDFCRKEIQALTNKTFINPIACYLNFYYEGKISQEIYNFKKKEITTNYQKKLANEKAKRKLENDRQKALGLPISPAFPKPIKSHLFENIVNQNFDSGLISDVDYCNYLGFSKKQKNKFFKELYR